MTVRKLLVSTTAACSLLPVLAAPVFAASLNQIAYNLEISDSNAANGSIVSAKAGVYSLSQIDYDPGIYGVIQNDAAVVLNQDTGKTRPVVTSGQALVRVSAASGDIKEGDLITTSKDKGVGQKATKSGHILGKALGDFPIKGDNNKEGLIPVLISINYNQISAQSEQLTQTGIDQVARKVSSALVQGNLASISKYIFAMLLGLITFFWGFAHFVRSNSTAVEAIARNPTAKEDIQKQQIIGSIVIIVVCALGLGVAVGILVFL